MRGSRTESSPVGTAVFEDSLPLRYDCNYLLVDALPATVGPAEVMDEAERFERRAIMVRDAETGERLAPHLADRGWRVHRGILMRHAREPDRRLDVGVVREVDETALRPARRRAIAEEPWATPEVIEQLLDFKLLIGRPPMTARFFAGMAGDEVVAWTDLYTDGRTGQVEDVGTLPEYRNRGYASALVLRGIEEARRAGCDFVFLVADADDWPQLLYRKLGFEELGRYVKFVQPD